MKLVVYQADMAFSCIRVVETLVDDNNNNNSSSGNSNNNSESELSVACVRKRSFNLFKVHGLDSAALYVLRKKQRSARSRYSVVSFGGDDSHGCSA